VNSEGSDNSGERNPVISEIREVRYSYANNDNELRDAFSASLPRLDGVNNSQTKKNNSGRNSSRQSKDKSNHQQSG
jgi:hypothetical protein